MKDIHPALYVFALQNPFASVRMKGKQLYWKDEETGRENSITFFEDSELEDVKIMVKNCNDIVLIGNIRFSSTN